MWNSTVFPTIGNVLLYNSSNHFLNSCSVSYQAYECIFSFNTRTNCMECVLFLFSCTKEKWRHRGVVYSLHDHWFNELWNCGCGWIISPVPLVLLWCLLVTFLLFLCFVVLCWWLCRRWECPLMWNKVLGRMHTTYCSSVSSSETV